MRPIRFVQIGWANNTVIHNLALNLNYIQSEFLFKFNDDVVQYPEDISLSNPVSTGRLESLALKYCSDKYPDEYPVAICDCPLEDELSTSFDNRVALISTYGWTELFSPYSTQDCLAFFLVDILLSFYVSMPVHYETRGCPMDYCEHKEDVKIGLAKSDFCSECRLLILRAIARGQITIQQTASVHKVLDSVAKRRICFVLMPFREEFSQIYLNHVKPTFVSNGWECRRADEIYEAREVMNIICEQIIRSDLIIAEITGRNANVFYELGYAHALGKNTVLITQDIKDVPFDLRHRQLVEYSDTPEGLQKLSTSLTKYLQT
jgi:hypothetical protein